MTGIRTSIEYDVTIACDLLWNEYRAKLLLFAFTFLTSAAKLFGTIHN